MSLICPHCEKALGAEHEGKACSRRMSRRFFFGLAVAPLAVAIAAKLPAEQNPVRILRDLLVRSGWPPAQIDEASFQTAAVCDEAIPYAVGFDRILSEMIDEGSIVLV